MHVFIEILCLKSLKPGFNENDPYTVFTPTWIDTHRYLQSRKNAHKKVKCKKLLILEEHADAGVQWMQGWDVFMFSANLTWQSDRVSSHWPHYQEPDECCSFLCSLRICCKKTSWVQWMMASSSAVSALMSYSDRLWIFNFCQLLHEKTLISCV